jgi:pyruvate dehydrogenase E2 component (dihydrolipoamide acetyltransferase)
MPQYIVMPALSPNMTEGKVARWLKSEGEAVRAGEVIAEIETDKATLEYEAPSAGTLGRVLVPAGGDAVAVDAPIAILLAEGEPAAALPDATPAPAARAAAPKVAAVVARGSTGAAARVFATPIARRLAREQGLPLSSIVGSGPNGRIVKHDVLRAADTAPARPVGVTPAAPAAPRAVQPPLAGTSIPHTAMRRVIARRLTEAKQTIPHYYLTIDVELDAALELRKRLNARPGADYAITVNDFVVKAVAAALRQVPAANAVWTEEAIVRLAAADVAVAVATEAGLLTPVVRDADRKSVPVISNELRDLAARARAGKLRPDEYQGGSFTVSNLGMHGIREFAAILNPPQSGILAVGVAEPRPVVRDGAIVVRTMMTCTLSADHRTVDGAVGAAFLGAFKASLEDPLVLFL